jgi:hypothetical protein
MIRKVCGVAGVVDQDYGPRWNGLPHIQVCKLDPNTTGCIALKIPKDPIAQIHGGARAGSDNEKFHPLPIPAFPLTEFVDDYAKAFLGKRKRGKGQKKQDQNPQRPDHPLIIAWTPLSGGNG